MTLLETIDRAATHPLTVASVAVGFIGSMVQIPVVSAFVWTAWNQAGTLFAVVSLLSSQGWLPSGTGEAAVLVAASLFLARMLDKLWDGINRRIGK